MTILNLLTNAYPLQPLRGAPGQSQRAIHQKTKLMLQTIGLMDPGFIGAIQQPRDPTATRISIVTTGLVLNLDAGDSASYPGSGTTWTDLSGNGNGTFGSGTQAPTYSGENGGCIVFDGLDDKVTVATSSVHDFSASRITIELWMKTNGGLQQQQLVTTDNTFDTSTWALGFSSSTVFGFVPTFLGHGSGAAATSPRTARSLFLANTWTHVVAVSSGEGQVGKCISMR